MNNENQNESVMDKEQNITTENEEFSTSIQQEKRNTANHATSGVLI